MAFAGKNTDELLTDIGEKLESILRVLSLQLTAERSVTEAAYMLKTTGMDTKTIAELLNTSPETIRVLLSRSKKR